MTRLPRAPADYADERRNMIKMTKNFVQIDYNLSKSHGKQHRAKPLRRKAINFDQTNYNLSSNSVNDLTLKRKELTFLFSEC